MGLFGWFQRTSRDERRARRNERRARAVAYRHPSAGTAGWFGSGDATASGINVDEATALTCSAVYAGTRILAETVASLPLKIYRRLPNGGKEPQAGHPLWALLHDAPNREMSSFGFRESRQAYLALWGNGYGEIEFSKGGRIIGLWPLPSENVAPERSGSEIVYAIGAQSAPKTKVPASNIFHVPGFGFDGLVGKSVIGYMRETVGEALAAQKAGASFWKNGARPAGILEHPGSLKPEAYTRLKEQWDLAHSGSDNTGKTVIAEDGMKFSPISIPPEDAQFLETRKFHVTDVARMFRIPPHMLGDLEKATFSNIEHQAIEFVTHTIRPWLVRWEQSISRQLLTQRERDAGFFAEFVVDGLLRGDTKSRFEAHSIARQGGWMCVNEIRAIENMNPIDGGDEYLSPLNMTPVGQPASDEGRAIAAHRQHLVDGFARILAKEAKAMRLAARNADGFAEAVDRFYGKHPAHVEQVIGPAVRACAATCGYGDSVDIYIADLASKHAAESAGEMRQLGALRVEAELRVWEEVVPGRMADLVIAQLGGAP